MKFGSAKWLRMEAFRKLLKSDTIYHYTCNIFKYTVSKLFLVVTDSNSNENLKRKQTFLSLLQNVLSIILGQGMKGRIVMKL